jgi:GT2 family glycosyltransferase
MTDGTGRGSGTLPGEDAPGVREGAPAAGEDAPAAGEDAPVVSVIVVTRDRPAELRECVAAALAQDCAEPLEVIVVFDQSPVEATLVAEEPGRSVSVLANSRTPGLAGGRNTGVLAARGSIVAFCDDDDVWLPGKLGRQLAVLAAEPETELVSCGIRVRYGDRVVERVLDRDRVEFGELLASRLTELHPSTFVIRRAALLSGLGLVDEELPGSYAEDYELLLRAARRRPIRVVREVLVEIRWHPQSYFAARWQMISAALRHLLDRYPEFAGTPAGEARITGQVAFAEAAQSHRRDALRWARRTVRCNRRERRAYLAAAVACGVLRPDAVLRWLNRQGRGL